jgi:predicted secreted protein
MTGWSTKDTDEELATRARAPNRRTQPRAVVYGTPARSAAGRTPHPPPATSASTEPMVSAASSRQASVNAGSSA